MPRRPTPPQETPPSITPRQAIPLLEGQLERLKKIYEKQPIDNTTHKVWESFIRELLIKSFGSASRNINDVLYADGGPLRIGMSQHEIEQNRIRKTFNQIALLQGCIDQLKTEAQLQADAAPASVALSAGSGRALDNEKVFVVHGHNDSVRDNVAGVISTLDLEPIILHEKANQGQTLVEKFLRHSDVGFAVIIMTADDTGKANTEETPHPRARQNVVFEWGYFVGKLGRERVCALYEQGIEPPSDLHGIVYIALDAAGHWRFNLVKELKAAGYSVDANKLLE